jgi:hypothetical protein
MRVRTVLNALLAAAAFPWHGEAEHVCHDRAVVV